MLNLKKRKLKGDMVAIFKYLKGCHIGVHLPYVTHEDRARTSGLKLIVVSILVSSLVVV